MDKLLTVIIPVYKTSATVDRCVESVVGQDYRRLEIILVDDGSPDDCPQKCDAWAARDSRIRVAHKANGGLGDARNCGLDMATGDYVTFVDSDDFLAPGTYAGVVAMLEAHPDYGFVEFGVCKFHGSRRQSMLALPDREYRSAADYWLGCCAYAHSYMWNKVYRRQLFDGVRHPPRTAFEDLYTLPLLLAKAKAVATTSQGLYYYCWNGGGITATAGGDEHRALLEAHLRVMDGYAGLPGFGRYYMHVLNIQLTECAFTGDRPRLAYHKVPPGECSGAVQALKAMALNALGMARLCRVYCAIYKMFGLGNKRI